MKTFKILILQLVIFVSAAFNLSAQDNGYLRNNLSNSKNINIEKHILNEIEKGIMNGDVEKISRYFSSQPYLSFINGINGYYSANQAFYLLEEFFNVFKVVSFKFDHIKTENTIAYATGIYFYDKKGKRDSAKVYVILNKIGSNWSVTQISVN